MSEWQASYVSENKWTLGCWFYWTLGAEIVLHRVQQRPGNVWSNKKKWSQGQTSEKVGIREELFFRNVTQLTWELDTYW